MDLLTGFQLCFAQAPDLVGKCFTFCRCIICLTFTGRGIPARILTYFGRLHVCIDGLALSVAMASEVIN
jgi:hypothetical protein